MAWQNRQPTCTRLFYYFFTGGLNPKSCFFHNRLERETERAEESARQRKEDEVPSNPSFRLIANLITVHIFEFTRTSEMYFTQSYAIKLQQHQELIKQLEEKGIKWKLHILQMGCRGFLPVTTTKILRKLGNSQKMTSTQFTQLYKKISHQTIKKAVAMIRTRNRLERDPSTRPYSVRKGPAYTAQELAKPSGRLAIQAAKQKQKELRRRQGNSKKPPK